MLLLALALLAAPAQACRLLLEHRFEAPFHTYGAVAVGLGDRAVVAGGAREQGTSGDVWTLVSTEQAPGWTWTAVDSDLTWRRFGRGGLLRDEILLADGQGGGRQPETFPVTTVEGLTLGERVRRRVVGQAPTERYLGGAAVYRSELWLGGGHDLTGWFMDRVDVLDPETGSWRKGPPLSQGRDTQLVVVAGRLFALGGAGRAGVSTTVERLSRDGNSWEPRSPLPQPTSGYAVATVGEQLFLFGDRSEPGRVLRYDSHADQWHSVQANYEPRFHAAAAAVGDRIVVVGGTTGGPSWMHTTEVFRVECAAD